VGGGEPNASNTIAGSCVDGEIRTDERWNATDRIRVSTLDGAPFAPGAPVRVEATVWASSTPSVDAVDFYYAADANDPRWRLIGSAVPPVAGALSFSATYTLPAGGLQAVRVQYRQKGTNAPCTTGQTADRDDLVFAVANQ
jgi:leucyl aminopeptidase